MKKQQQNKFKELLNKPFSEFSDKDWVSFYKFLDLNAKTGLTSDDIDELIQK